MTELKSPASEKRKFALWISKETIEKAKESYKDDNCSSASEFIEKAILFYLGYLSSQENQDYLAQVIPSTVKGIVDESANRMGRLLFKMAVEMAGIGKYPSGGVRGRPAGAEAPAWAVRSGNQKDQWNVVL